MSATSRVRSLPSLQRGFTLIELLIVISIIGVLASATLAYLNEARFRSMDAAAQKSGDGIAKAILNCGSDNGKVTVPNSTTAPTNNICNRGAQYGVWPAAPRGWTWDQTIHITGSSGAENMIHAVSSYGNEMFCGHYPPFDTPAYCNDPNAAGLCRVGRGYSCAFYDADTGQYK